MKELYCNLSVSTKLINLGFNEHCTAYFSLDNYYPVDKYDILSHIQNGELITEERTKYFECLIEDFKFLKSPTIDQSKNWFLDNYGLIVDVITAFSGKFDSNKTNLLYCWKPSIDKIKIVENNLFTIERKLDLFSDNIPKSRYEAQMMAFEKAIEIVENLKQ